ncbi:juvenile hormone esterase-like [Pectinophora gossypiella]|uniref:juvenile hormone esterase-like n=1 Tax=Pectinophora gossypiella TaxID=13191 RepID=UPI00214E782D|nr:juvenile hormone esterase-like [Pectinophora gossypiella]
MFVFLILHSVVMLSHFGQSVIVKIEQGWLLGEELVTNGAGSKYFSFKGIPYAKPPLGTLRFKAPQPAEPWKGTRDATQHGSICTQFNIFEAKIVPGSEDCLFLNVYTPNINPETLLPVMFFIHGGAFTSDSGNVDFLGPDFLLPFDVVVVTINYRLEVLGFLKLDIREVPGNAGMKDQNAALKWVQKNIKQFGGDPNQVTIFGQSAGGASVGFHMLSPMSKGLFHRAISMSGCPLNDFPTAFEVKRKSFILGKQLGCYTDNPHELLEFLQGVPVEKLLNVNTSAIIAEDHLHFYQVGKLFHFLPTVELDYGQERFMIEDPLTALKKKHVNDVDFMAGYTNKELLYLLFENEEEIFKRYTNHFDMFVPTKILLGATPKKVLEVEDIIIKQFFGNKRIDLQVVDQFLNYLNEATLSYDIYRFMDYMTEVGTCKRYFYIFTCQTGRNALGNKASAHYGIPGAAHRDDLNYLFDAKKLNIPIDPNSTEYELVVKISSLFTNFAKSGDPNSKSTGPIWQGYGKNNKNILEIGRSLNPGSADYSHVCFWNSIYEKARIVI